jgi:hypothetical protein
LKRLTVHFFQKRTFDQNKLSPELHAEGLRPLQRRGFFEFLNITFLNFSFIKFENF